MADHKKLTTNQGVPIGDNQNSRTAGRRGPTLLEDYQLVEKLAHFDRERIPERVVHARGAGAHGVFKVKKHETLYKSRLSSGRERNTGICPSFYSYSWWTFSGNAP